MTKQPPNPPNPDDLVEFIVGKIEKPFSIDMPAADRHFGIRIARDGTWHYLGTPINRMPLVKLFSTVLRRENDRYWLVTPAERGLIDVDDAPFVAVEVTVEGEGQATQLTFRTNLDEEILAGPEHPIRVEIDPESEEPAPYIHVRDNLEALIARPVFYELAELAEEVEDGQKIELRIWSGGAVFSLGMAGTGE